MLERHKEVTQAVLWPQELIYLSVVLVLATSAYMIADQNLGKDLQQFTMHDIFGYSISGFLFYVSFSLLLSAAR